MASRLYDKIVITPQTNVDTFKPKTYSGFSTVNNDNGNYNLYDFQLIQQDILNHFHIRQGERLMHQCDFGCIIWDLLFDPLTDELKYVITQNVNKIINYDPRISASEVQVSAYDTGIQIECILTYLPYNISQSMRLQFDQNNGLVTN